ncbi:MAG: sigma-70 family RNA polymerase sigma factor [Alcaligenes sp.]|nr:sigma-70 family RNA polymerase sigma factor [Alcaligenes sp.]HCA16005.1 RNA polymerase subunit sigma [Alcaligenes faecalis]
MHNASFSPDTESLYRNYHGWLHGWLRRRLGNSFDAADLAQDVFVRLLQKPRHFGSEPEARVYLRLMANGMCVDLWRRRQIEQAWLEELANRPAALAPSAEHQALVLEALHEIDSMLRTLPAKVGNAFFMAMADGMSNREIADALGVSTRMVHKYISQAMLCCLQLEARQTLAETPVYPRPCLSQPPR